MIFEDEGGGILTQRRLDRSRTSPILLDKGDYTAGTASTARGTSDEYVSGGARALLMQESEKSEDVDEPVDYEIDTAHHRKDDDDDHDVVAKGSIYVAMPTEGHPGSNSPSLQPALSPSRYDAATVGALSPTSRRKKVTFSVEHTMGDQEGGVDSKEGLSVANGPSDSNQASIEKVASSGAAGPSRSSREPSDEYKGQNLTLEAFLRAKKRQDKERGGSSSSSHHHRHKHRHRSGGPSPHRSKAENPVGAEERRRVKKEENIAAAAAIAAQRMPRRFFVELMILKSTFRHAGALRRHYCGWPQYPGGQENSYWSAADRLYGYPRRGVGWFRTEDVG